MVSEITFNVSIRLLINKGVANNLNLYIASKILINKSCSFALNSISDIEPAHNLFFRCILKARAFMAMHVYPSLTNALGILPQNPIGTGLSSTFA